MLWLDEIRREVVRANQDTNAAQQSTWAWGPCRSLVAGVGWGGWGRERGEGSPPREMGQNQSRALLLGLEGGLPAAGLASLRS